ncbi:tape measure protein [Shewanella glacialimarina]|uniref:tape measure protein n=1 Tax=Shewanella glacialimarina TaxID=2590884 RepID=UPI001CF819E7|nr:tape measure protein [Shewanella glacialimarina]UCX03573.1 tape measure protein [Shewanella glacialimarina]
MSFKDQVINLIIQGKDLFSSEAKKSEKALAELASESEILNARLKELEDLQAAANSIDGLTSSIIKGEKAYKDNSVALDKLVVQQKVAAKELKQFEAAQKAAEGSTNQLEQEYNQAQAALVKYETELQQARVEVEKLSSEQQQSATASKEQAAALTKAKTDLQQLTTEQTSAKNAATELATALDTQRRELLEVSTATDEASRNKAEYTLQVKTARTELNQLERSLNKNKSELDQNTASINKAGISMDKLADASADLKQQQIAGEAALKGVNTKLERHNKLLNESQKQAGDFGGSVKSATASLVAMAGAYIGVDRLWESLKSILTAGDEAKAFGVQMSAMMGSIAGGEQATAWIKDFANNTATRLDTAKKAFASLKTFGIDPMNGSLQSMVDYNARLGGSQEKLEGIILAVGQAWAKQKLQGEEILQLVERGVPVWDLLEKVTGKNVTQLQKMSAAGELGRDVIKQLFDEMGKQANGQASKSLELLGGQINLISNKWTEFKEIIADSGAYQVAVDLLKDINATFNELNQSGKIKQAAQDISDFFTTILKDGGESIKTTLANITAFTTSLNVIAGSIRLVFNVLTGIIATFGAAVAGAFAMFPLGMAKALSVFGSNALSNAFQKQADLLLTISKAYVDQVKQDATDAAAALGQLGIDVQSDSNETTKTQVENAEKVKAAMQSQAEARLNAYQKDVATSEKLSNLAQKEVDDWKARQKAAEEHYTKLKSSGTATLEEIEAAETRYGNATLKVTDLLVAQSSAQRDLTDSQLKLNDATVVFLSAQSELADRELSKVRDAYIDGKASIEDYEKAQVKAKTATESLAKAQGELVNSTDAQTKAVNAYEAAMEQANVTTLKSLQELATKAKKAYEQTNEAIKNGVGSTYDAQQAFLKYAEAAIKAAAAGDQQVDASIRQQAANLGLVDNIDQLIGQYQRLKEVQGNVGNDAEENEVRVANANKGIGTTMENTMGVVVKSAEQAGTSLAGVAEFFTDFLRGVTAEVAELSKGAVAYFKSILYGQTLLIDSSSELDKTIETYRSLTGEINELQNQLAIAIDFTGISTFARKAEIAGKQAQAAYYGQRIELLKMVDALNAAEGGNIGLIRSAERAANSMNLMNDQDLGALKSAIDSAKSSMDSLRDSAQSTLDTLQDELDGYLGRQDEIEKRRYQQELTEIKAQLTKAERTGDQTLINQLREAEKTLGKVYAFRTAEIKAQQESDKQRAITDTQNLKQQTTPQKTIHTPAPQTSPSQTTVAASSSDKVVLQLQVGNRTFDAQTKRSIVNELVAEIKRLQSVGG